MMYKLLFKGCDARTPLPRLGFDVAGFFGHGVYNAIARAPSSYEIVSFQGEAMADFLVFGISKGDVAPPGAVVVPEMVIGVQCATGDELQMCGGHGSYDELVF